MRLLLHFVLLIVALIHTGFVLKSRSITPASCFPANYFTTAHTMDDNSAISSGAGDDAQAVAAGQDAPGDVVGAPSQASGRLPLSFKVETGLKICQHVGVV